MIDVGTPGLDLAPFLLGADAIVFVDSVNAGDTPGTVRVYRREELLRPARGVSLVGVVPHAIAPRARLSPAVRAAVRPAMATVVAELERLGAAITLKAAPAVPRPWWERTGSEAVFSSV